MRVVGACRAHHHLITQAYDESRFVLIVIPAKAGTQLSGHFEMDPGFRRDDDPRDPPYALLVFWPINIQIAVP